MANKFSKVPFASLINTIRQNVTRFGRYGIINNRDGRINRLAGYGNGTERALEVLADPFAQSCYDRLLEIMAYASPILEVGADDEKSEAAMQHIQKYYIDLILEESTESLAIAKVTGCSAHENNYGVDKDGKVIVSSLTPIDSDRLVYTVKQNSGDSQLRIQTFNKPFEGEEPPLNKVVDYTYYSVSINNPYGFGVGSQLIDVVAYKERLLELWIKIAERFSYPLKIAKVPNTAEAEEIDELFAHFKEMSENATFVLPPDFDLNVVDISATGADSLLKSLIDYCDERIASLILGENLTGKEIANGAQARDAIASKISERKALSLLNGIARRLNKTTFTWLTLMNFPGATPPRLKFVYEQSKTELADRILIAKQIGVPLDMEKVAELLDVPYDDGPRPGLGNIENLGKSFTLPS